MGFVEGPLEALALGICHVKLLELHHDGVLVEYAHHDRLTMDAGQRDHAQVDVAAVDSKAHAPVLGQAPLGDVQLRHDLHARDTPGGHATRDGRDVLHDPVHTHPHTNLVTVWSEVHIRGTALDRLGDDLVDELYYGRVIRGLAQVDDLGLALIRLLDGALAGDDVVQARHARDQVPDRLGRGDGDAH